MLKSGQMYFNNLAVFLRQHVRPLFNSMLESVKCCIPVSFKK